VAGEQEKVAVVPAARVNVEVGAEDAVRAWPEGEAYWNEIPTRLTLPVPVFARVTLQLDQSWAMAEERTATRAVPEDVDVVEEAEDPVVVVARVEEAEVVVVETEELVGRVVVEVVDWVLARVRVEVPAGPVVVVDWVVRRIWKEVTEVGWSDVLERRPLFAMA
jgi:hypothetical protein